ncbi:endoglucanase-6B [Plectosphaerella plurivora]|uniref:Glucanase n=1 Tax=Plectosphaerella plurivora TaxID=936078 RepID=A0A9P8V610_9PEZI|nr:endoglucanase-6B [Plectosphaerella plurivora]
MPEPRQTSSTNPFEGRQILINPNFVNNLQRTKRSFLARNDVYNAGKVQYVQDNVGTFSWIANIASLGEIDVLVEKARTAQRQTGKKQIIGLVLYNVPDRDCGTGESSGELSTARDGLRRYREQYVDPFAMRVHRASDMTFAIAVEPDALGNMLSSDGSVFCASAREPQKDGIAYAIQHLQAPHINLYLDISHGGWLGWNDTLGPLADEVTDIMRRPGSHNKVRGFVSNISNYNPFHVDVPPPYAVEGASWTESLFATNAAPHFRARGLPTRFIVDQGRVAIREDQGLWCNPSPAGLGHPPTTQTGNDLVDSIVWIKVPGESDGRCGMPGAPGAGAWFEAGAQMLVQNADPAVLSIPVRS